MFPLLIIYLALLFLCAENGRPSAWHTEYVTDWEHQRWHEISSRSSNLLAIGRADVESFYFGMLAAQEVGSSEQEKQFANLLLHSRFLNHPIESGMALSIHPANVLDLIRLHRTRITLALASLLLITNLLALWKRSPSLWQILLPAAGSILLVL